MKLYGASQSPFVRKVLVVLEEKKLPYQLEAPAPGLHPLGKMPLLRDGEVVVPDSSVICAYLEKKHPAPPLYPEDPADYARALFLEEYADTQMSEGMGAIVFERFVKPHVLKQPTDEARVEQLLAAARTRWVGKPSSAAGHPLPSVLDYLESELPEGRDTVLARFSIADAALGVHLGWLAFAGIELDARRWPRTARYYGALVARPSFETASA
jgi:glutathione S-transferase